MSELRVDALRSALEGIMASVLGTCDGNGLPNVSMISQVHYVDPEHVALSYQFFNKTRRNILATRRASVLITNAVTLCHYRLSLVYEETQTSGPLFESMKAKLAGIASHHGVDGVFRLLGSDVFRVEAIEALPGPTVPPPAHKPSLLAATRRCCAALDACSDLEELLDCATASLAREFGIEYSMVLMTDAESERLYTVASHGYATTGAGAEVALGEGVIGVAARENAPIRIGHMTREYRYGAMISTSAFRTGVVVETPRLVPFPGLATPRSQIALPVAEGPCVAGVLFAEADVINRFGYEEEDALALVAGHLAARMALLRQDGPDEAVAFDETPEVEDGEVRIRFFQTDQSVFIDNDYLIKGVAGAILWRVLRENQASGRTEFTTRELRLDPGLRLPAHAENLDARLILLRKRLEDRDACVRIEKAGRGRFRLHSPCRMLLDELDA